MRHAEVEDWPAQGWEHFPPVTEHEVQQKLLSMHAVAAPGHDGIVARCVQEAAPTLVPIL